MAKYEYELLEEQKKQQTNIAIIIAIIIPVVMFIIGILWGINQLNTNAGKITGKVIEGQTCNFCFNASLLPKNNTINLAQNITPTPVESVNFKFNFEKPKCIDIKSDFNLIFTIKPDKSVTLNKLLLYTPLSYTLNLVQDQTTGDSYEFTANLTTGAKVNSIILDKTANLFKLKLNGDFKKAGKYNILPILQLKSGQKQTLATIPLLAVSDCNAQNLTPTPSINQITSTPTPTQEQEIITPTEQAPTTTPVPNTGVIDNIAYFTIGIVIGIVILSIKKIKFINFNSVNKFIFNVYATAEDLFARTFSSKVYKEKKILDKVLSKSTNKKKSSSPK